MKENMQQRLIVSRGDANLCLTPRGGAYSLLNTVPAASSDNAGQQGIQLSGI